MKILIVSQYFWPENVSIPIDVAEGLARKGHSVRVLTGYPNYPEGKTFPGYRQQWRKYSEKNGIEICRVPLYPSHSQNAFSRMLNYVSFAFSSASARSFARDADVIYVYATQMTASFGPWVWRKWRGAPFLLHVVDLWPDSVLGSSLLRNPRMSRIAQKVLSTWIDRVYDSASLIVGISPTMVETLKSRVRHPQRTELIYNWADNFPESDVSLEMKLPKSKHTNIVYAGNVGEMQDLDIAIRAAVRVAGSGVQLSIVGDGIAKQNLMRLTEDLGATNIRFQDSVPRELMAEIYAQADFALVSLKDLQVFRGTIPSKFPSVLAYGIPAITTVQGDVRIMNEENELGIAADSESVDDLERAFREAANLSPDKRKIMSFRVRKFAKELFSKESAISTIESLLVDVAEERQSKND